MKDKWYESLLCCPQCGSYLNIDVDVSCQECDFYDETGADLRLQHRRHYKLNVPSMDIDSLIDKLNHIDLSRPAITYNGPNALRDSRQLMSELTQRIPQDGDVLDLGCGPRDQFIPLSHLGFRYVGIDYQNTASDFLADGHAIPFQNESFDCVFSYAVLEHLHNPFIAINEIARVLKPNGWYIGTVSQGEPFHSSFFHHTPWGLLSLVGSMPNLEIIRIWDSSDTLLSLSSMGRYSHLIKLALAGLNRANSWLPWLTPRKMMWPEREKRLDSLYRAGSICFSIQKSVSDNADI